MDIWQLYMHINLVIALYNWSIRFVYVVIYLIHSEFFMVLVIPYDHVSVRVKPSLIGHIDVGDGY